MCSPIEISRITGQPIPISHREHDKLNVPDSLQNVSSESDDSEVDEDTTGEPDARETQRIMSEIKALLEPREKKSTHLKRKLRKFKTKCKDSDRKCAEQAAELKSLKETIASLKVKLEDYAKQRTALLANKDRIIEKHEEERRARDQEINRHVKEKGRLMREYNKQTQQLEAKVAFAASQLEAEKTKHRKLEDELDKVRSSNTQLSQTKKFLEDELSKERVSNTQLSQSKKSLEDELGEERVSNTQLSQGKKSLEDELGEERASNTQLSQAKKTLEDELDRERVLNTQLSQANKSLEKEAKQLQNLKELLLEGQKPEESLTASCELTPKLGHTIGHTAAPHGQEDLETDGCGGVQLDVLSASKACLCPLSMEAVIEFSSEMTPRWEAIGHGLSIGSSTIQSLRNHPCSQDSKCIQMLEKWFENGIDVSWERLFSVLRGQKMMSLISAMSRRAKS